MNNAAAIAIIAGIVGYWLGQSQQPDACVVEPLQVTASEPAEPESLFVSSDQPAVVIVADLSSEYAAKWLANDAEKLRANGWNVRSLDLQGCDDVRFYVFAKGSWRVHNGHMSLNSLRMMLGN